MRKFCLVKSHTSKNQQLDAYKGFAWESRIPRSIFVNDLNGIEDYIISIRNEILISIAHKSWTRMECGILLPKHAIYHHFTNYWL